MNPLRPHNPEKIERLKWNLKFFFHGINFYYKRGYFCEKRGWKSSKTKKFFFAQIPHAFIQCIDIRPLETQLDKNLIVKINNFLDIFIFNILEFFQSYWSLIKVYYFMMESNQISILLQTRVCCIYLVHYLFGHNSRSLTSGNFVLCRTSQSLFINFETLYDNIYNNLQLRDD